jgi:hypothetical protein
MHSQWGDPFISAPNEGSWNHRPFQTLGRSEAVKPRQSKTRRFASLLWPHSSLRRENSPCFIDPISTGQHEFTLYEESIVAKEQAQSPGEQNAIKEARQSSGKQIGRTETFPLSSEHNDNIDLPGVDLFEPNISQTGEPHHSPMASSLQGNWDGRIKSLAAPRSTFHSATARVRTSTDQRLSTLRSTTSIAPSNSGPVLYSTSRTSVAPVSHSVLSVNPNNGLQHDWDKLRPHGQGGSVAGPQQLVPSDEELWG